MQGIAFQELCDTIKKFKDRKVAITFHSIGDRDAVCSAVALSLYFKNAAVVTPDFITSNAKRALAYLKMQDAVKIALPSDAELIMVLDANNFFAIGKLKAEIERSHAAVVVIDHHTPHNSLPEDVTTFNDESYNSTSSIVYEVLKRLGFQVSEAAAILLLNGIIADSAELQNSSPLTFRQISELLEVSKRDFSFFTEYFREIVPVENKLRVIKEISEAKAEIVGRYIIIYGRASEHANVAADYAVKLDADVSVFWVSNRTEASISARLRPNLEKEIQIHLGSIMQEIGQIVGGEGGGHAAAAGAYGPIKEAAQIAGQEAVRRIKEKLALGR